MDFLKNLNVFMTNPLTRLLRKWTFQPWMKRPYGLIFSENILSTGDFLLNSRDLERCRFPGKKISSRKSIVVSLPVMIVPEKGNQTVLIRTYPRERQVENPRPKELQDRETEFMLIQKHTPLYHFIGRTEDGVTFRWGKTIDDDPVCAPWPELADISISNHCSFGCDFCYRNSKPDNSFMSFKDYIHILDQLSHPRWGSVFQVALGGGEPLEHPAFFDIIEETHARHIIANFTTNGQFLTPEVAKKLQGKIGAAAFSLQEFSHSHLSRTRYLTDQGIKANLHFILDSGSLDEAICFLKGQYDQKLSNINAVVFLTYKHAGRASASKCLKK